MIKILGHLLFAYVQMTLTIAHADITSDACGLNLYLGLFLDSYFMYASSEGSENSLLVDVILKSCTLADIVCSVLLTVQPGPTGWSHSQHPIGPVKQNYLGLKCDYFFIHRIKHVFWVLKRSRRVF